MQKKIIKPSGAAGVQVGAARDDARQKLDVFVQEVRTLDTFMKAHTLDEIVKNSPEDRTAANLERWFGSFNADTREALILKATRMSEMIGGTTGWKFHAYPLTNRGDGRHAETNFGVNEIKLPGGVIQSPAKSINLFKSWFTKDLNARSNIIIHEAVHATNGKGVGQTGKQGHWLRASRPTERELMEFTSYSAGMTTEQAIQNGDSWECYFGEAICLSPR